MITKETARDVIDYGLSLGADFCELFIEKNQSQYIQLLDQKVNNLQGGISFGVGVRLLFGTKVLYGHTNKASKEELKFIVKSLCAKDRRDPRVNSTNFSFEQFTNIHPTLHGLNNDILLDEKVRYLMKVDKAARDQSEKIVQLDAGSLQRHQQIEIFNSEGLHIGDERHYTRIFASAIAKDGAEQNSSFEGPGALMGWDFTAGVNPQALGEEVARQALLKLTADECPGGKLPVIIDNGFGGVIFHEACGHLLETTSVAKKASVFHDKMGQMIANPVVSAVDDGLIQNAWGSLTIDDEGMKTRKTQLIKDGKLESFMVDKVGAMKTGFERTGSGRRQNYRYAPTSRMRNTYIEPGHYSLEEMVSTIDHGIYCKKMGGGSVNPGTGEFNFAAQESYLIKNGKIDRPLKSATLIGTGPETLQKISMVGNNLDMAAGMCGSSSGSLPVTVGQAALKVDEILVGGNA
ncbi:TldD/PmbA family protein [Halobacteriovorax sp. GB3]|uniref:TldD/PmbA family protein n=1 Tax=Halobacteriovorax sp. GB3 TaxID=2719615 RepID=UPI00236004CC|nr:TldD/PmbA family protein [Halobacteriovorax sp. GB3]MDD0852902.1 TldD/PmbA family protein [Halobacteriovorax sp. GB3]